MTQTDSQYQFTFLRHGESLGNAEQRVQGQGDYPLTAKGRQQALALAAYWQQSGICFDAIISSPQTRARHTAEAVAAALGLTIILDPIWMERDFGVLEGLPYATIREIQPPVNFFSPEQPPAINGESLLDLYARAGRARQSLLERLPGKYLIVSHGAMLNMLLFNILGLSPHTAAGKIRFYSDNTGFTTLNYSPDKDIWRVYGFNQHPHLDKLCAEPSNQ